MSASRKHGGIDSEHEPVGRELGPEPSSPYAPGALLWPLPFYPPLHDVAQHSKYGNKVGFDCRWYLHDTCNTGPTRATWVPFTALESASLPSSVRRVSNALRCAHSTGPTVVDQLPYSQQRRLCANEGIVFCLGHSPLSQHTKHRKEIRVHGSPLLTPRNFR